MLCNCDGNAQSAGTKPIVFDSTSLTPRTDPLIIGVGIHFGIGGEYNYVADKTAAAIRELGADSFRDDLPWSTFDLPGRPAGDPEPRKLFDFLKLGVARPLIVVGHPNPAIAGGNPPITDAGRAAFADFAARAAMATKSFKPIYEVWNEWNMNAKPVSDPKQWLVGPGEASDPRAAVNYTALAQAAIPAIEKAEPGSTVLSGAVGMDQDWLWTRSIVEDGAINGATALSVHLYNHCDADIGKRTATEMIDRLTLLQASLKKSAAEMPIYVTEVGWPTALRPCVISKQAAADNIAQFLLWSAATPWLKGAWIYQLKDQGRDPNEMEQNFGVYDYDYRPKPAACAMREATKIIKASRAFRMERPAPGVFIIQVSGEQGLRLVAWTTDEAARTAIAVSGGTIKAQRLCNGPLPFDGRVAIGPEPVIVDIAGSETVSVSLAPQ
jgi:hypothetical protein